ncbi:MAG: amidohydrolase family protein [Bacteroidota bacterium]
MKKLFYILVGCLGLTYQGVAQTPVPAPAQSTPILLEGGTAHLGNGEVIQNSLIGFADGKLTVVQSADGAFDKSSFKVVNIAGKHVYPSFILPNSQMGLVEVSSVRAMSDARERGTMNPNIRSAISYNTDSEFIPTMRFNGILLAESAPIGGVISGTSSVMEMEGWNWEDAAHTLDKGLHVNWPSRISRRFDFATFTVKESTNKKYGEEVNALKDFFTAASRYGSEKEKVTNLKMEAMQGLFDGSKVLMLHVGGAKEIVEAVKFAQAQDIQKITVVTSSDALYVADFLATNKIPVVLPPTQRVPQRTNIAIDLPYELPHLLTQKGVMVSLSNEGKMAGNARNLPFFAGTAVAYGMDKEEALKTITSNTAEALGIADRVGTLTVGKDATLFVSEGDALDYNGNILNLAFISGKEVTLSGRQQELYERFSAKYGHEKK